MDDPKSLSHDSQLQHFFDLHMKTFADLCYENVIKLKQIEVITFYLKQKKSFCMFLIHCKNRIVVHVLSKHYHLLVSSNLSSTA